MNKEMIKTIKLIKLAHSLIWIIMVWAIFYILYAGIFGQLNTTLFLALGLIGLEFATLILNRGICPFTIIAKKVNPDWKDGDDIYLPVWLAMNNKTIFGTFLFVGMALVIFRVLTQR